MNWTELLTSGWEHILQASTFDQAIFCLVISMAAVGVPLAAYSLVGLIREAKRAPSSVCLMVDDIIQSLKTNPAWKINSIEQLWLPTAEGPPSYQVRVGYKGVNVRFENGENNECVKTVGRDHKRLWRAVVAFRKQRWAEETAERANTVCKLLLPPKPETCPKCGGRKEA